MSRETIQPVGTGNSNEDSASNSSRHAPAKENRASKPVTEVQRVDPRQFQLNQLRRRFSPGEKEEQEATILTFKLVPTDPDFPFEMTDLQCTLFVPRSYPATGQPSLRVTNPDMDKGYQINVERGFDSLVTAMPKSTLLALVNELDKRLEGFLMSEKAQTIKLVTNAGTKSTTVPLRSAVAPAIPIQSSTPGSSLLSARLKHTPQQKSEAKAKRESDIRQLEARMGRQPLFFKSPDNFTFSVPLQIPKSSQLPISFESVKSVTLFVPLLYNLEPCSISLVGSPPNEADTVRASFERHAKAHPEMTLMAHINHLAQNIQNMATEVSVLTAEIRSPVSAPSIETATQTAKDVAINQLEDRPHVQFIPRPPEWDSPRDRNLRGDSSGTDGSEDECSEDETNEEDGGATLTPEAQMATDTGPDLGILLSFPSLELYGTELLQLYSVSLTVKCDRCKETKDVKSIRSHAPGDVSTIKHESCNKCADQLSTGGQY